MTELILVLILVGLLALWVWSLLDAALRPTPQWHAIGRSKTGWMIALALLGWVATLWYLAAVRPRLRAVGPVESEPRVRPPRRRSDWGDPWAG